MHSQIPGGHLQVMLADPLSVYILGKVRLE
jgi:hypothetical protein